jgi:esterase/lipase superfamily enzyme
VLSFSNANGRRGKVAIKWIATAVLGGAGLATVTYSTSEKSPLKSPLAQLSVDGSGFNSLAEPLPLAADTPKKSSPAKKRFSDSLDLESTTSNQNESLRADSPTALAESSRSDSPRAFPSDTEGRKWVRVYFATDRSRLDLTGTWIYARLWLPVALGVLIASILALGIVAGVKRVIACVGTAIAVVMTAFFAQQAIVGTQTIQVLAQSSKVAFGTTRLSAKSSEYPLHVGVSEVTLPPNHRPGELERPSLLKLEWSEDDRKHVSLQRVDVMAPNAFFDDVKAKGRESALVFIHGFNVRFDDALRRTAQLTADLEYQGIPILYSWPSSGKTLAYTRDESNVGWTVPHLETFLMDLRERAKLKHIHVVAHSMGNRALLGVIERLGMRGSTESRLLSRVIMAAPDVDALEFQNRYSRLLQRVVTATTIYGSKNDRALQLSESIHGHNRLGLVSEEFGSIENIDMIDTSPLDLSLLGHSYYGDSPLVMDDIRAFLSIHATASSRPWLRMDASVAPHRVVWRFVPTAAFNSLERK